LPKLSVIDGQATTTSLDIADHFGKLHKNVIQAIERLECSEDFNRLNFQPVEYLDSKGEKRPMYNITRDGFTFLVMGFAGSKAAAWKEKYIRAFNLMEGKPHLSDQE
jgi:Rha family phage regulatory protein